MLAKFEDILLFLAILFLPTQLGRHFWPDFSYIYSLKVDYLSPTFYFWDILVLLLLVTLLLQKKRINFFALSLGLFFILTQLLSLFTSSNIGAGLVRAEQYFIACFFGICLASYKWELLKPKIFTPLLIAILAESSIAILQVLKSGSLGLWILGERTFSITTPAIAKFNFHGIEVLRPYATFPHPNVLAAFLIIGLLLLQTKIKVVNIITVIIIILTFSRTAILATIFSALLVLKKRLLLFAILILLIISPLLYIRFYSLFNFDNLTILRREELAASALALFSKNPLPGVGLNNFIPALSAELIAGPNRFLQPVHNIFLLSLAETGITGFLGLTVLIGYPFFKILKLYPLRFPLNPLLLVWGMILFLGLFDHYFLTLPQGYRLLFLVWGLSLSISNLKLSNEYT